MKKSRFKWTGSLHWQRPWIKRKAKFVRKYLETIVLFKEELNLLESAKLVNSLIFLDAWNRLTTIKSFLMDFTARKLRGNVLKGAYSASFFVPLPTTGMNSYDLSNFLHGNTPCDLTITQCSRANFVAWKLNAHCFRKDCYLGFVVLNLHLKVPNTYLDPTGTENHLKRFESRSLAAGNGFCIDSCHVCGEGGYCFALLLVPPLIVKMNWYDMLNCCTR